MDPHSPHDNHSSLSKFRISDYVSTTFRLKKGLRYGDPLSISMFKAVLEQKRRMIGINIAETVLNKCHHILSTRVDLLRVVGSPDAKVDIRNKLR